MTHCEKDGAANDYDAAQLITILAEIGSQTFELVLGGNHELHTLVDKPAVFERKAM